LSYTGTKTSVLYPVRWASIALGVATARQTGVVAGLAVLGNSVREISLVTRTLSCGRIKISHSCTIASCTIIGCGSALLASYRARKAVWIVCSICTSTVPSCS